MNRLRMTIAVAAIATIAASFGAWAARSAVDERPWSALVQEAFDSGASPGMAVAVVKDGRIWTAAYGVRDVESRAPVTADSRFYIASTSKALTALAAARLAAEKRFDLDRSLAKAFPSVRFPAGFPADSVRVRDLLTHTHGIDGNGPISIRVAFTGEYTNEELLRLLSNHERARTGRAFAYSNLGYELVGLLLAPDRRGGWKEVVEREVLAPLGMRATVAYRSKVPQDSIAYPHELGPNGFERIRLQKDDANMGPAGGHFSTAPDLARLVAVELGHGRWDGRQIFPRKVIDETQRKQVPQDRTFVFFHRDGWGLGWDLATYRGDRILSRYGGFSGYFSHVSFMPEHDVGVVVLVNGEGVSSRLAEIVASGIYDQLRDRSGVRDSLRARLSELEARRVRARDNAVSAREQRAARQASPLRHPLSAYAGTFWNDTLGTLALRLEDGRLQAAIGVAQSPVETFDPADRLRVELFGTGGVIDAIFAEGDTVARAMRFMDRRFERR